LGATTAKCLSLDGVAAAPHLPGSRIELDVGEAQQLVVARRGSPQQSAHPGDELLECKRLRDVVVGAGVQAGDTIVDLVSRCEHQHRYPVAAAAKPPADVQAVHVGHQHVENDGVRLAVAVRLEALQCLLAVGCELDLVPLELERSTQRLPHSAFVVDDQNLHSTIVLAKGESRLRGPTRASRRSG